MRTILVGCRVTDLDRSLPFYISLGYLEVGRVELDDATIDALGFPDDGRVAFELVHRPNGGPVQPGGFDHLAVQVDDLATYLQSLTDRGLQPEPPQHPGGPSGPITSWVVDPDGYRIELVQWPAGHPWAMTSADFDEQPATGTTELDEEHEPRQRSAKEVVQEFFARQQAADDTAIDLVAEDMTNHAAGPQGREGLKQILATITHDLGPIRMVQHHLVGDGDLVAQHLTLHGTHRESTMPLLAGVPPSGRSVTWPFIHLWRVANGQIVEPWACRDDLGLLDQLQTPADEQSSQ